MNQTLETESEQSPGEAPYYLPPIIFGRKLKLDIDSKEFYRFCRMNPGWRVERTAQGDVLFMAPTGGFTGHGNSRLITDFTVWSDQDGTGLTFDSDTGFRLPNNAVRSPDVSWVLKTRLATLTREQLKRFPPLCPNFVLELRSPSDALSALKKKMVEYQDNGARLGWLINPPAKEVFVYRPERKVDRLRDPASLSGEDVLPGFTLELDRLWRALEGKW